MADAVQWKLVKHENRDHVTLDNVAEFYGFTQKTHAGKDFALNTPRSSIKGQVDSRELLINNVKFILSYPVAEVDGQIVISRMDLSKLLEPVLRPSKIKGAGELKTIILDPGHGGHDLGARGTWGNEKDFSLDVAMRTRELLTRLGYDVKMTRTRDVFVPLEQRAAFANKYPNALFISVHFNSSSNHDATGIETYSLAPRGVPSTNQTEARASDFTLAPGNARDAENIALATAFHASLLRRLQLPDRGVKRARFHVIRNVRIPGVLLEGGFVSNAKDSRRIASATFRQEMAYAVVDAVKNYRAAVAGTPIRRIGERVSAEPTTDEPRVILQN